MLIRHKTRICAAALITALALIASAACDGEMSIGFTVESSQADSRPSADRGAALDAMRQAVIDDGYEVQDDYFFWSTCDSKPLDGFKLIYTANGVYTEISVLEFADEAAAIAYRDDPMGSSFKEKLLWDRFYAEIPEGSETFPNTAQKTLVERLFEVAKSVTPEETAGAGLTLESLRKAAEYTGFEIMEDYSDFGNYEAIDGFRLGYDDEHVYDLVDILEFASAEEAKGYPMGGLFAGDHAHIIVDRFVAELSAGTAEFPNDLELAVIQRLFDVAGADLSDAGTTEPPAGGVEKADKDEVGKLYDEITALFQPPPLDADEVAFDVLTRMMLPVVDIPLGDTRYRKYLMADYELKDGEWKPGKAAYIYEEWYKGGDFARTESLHVYDYFHPETEGDTECELIMFNGPDYTRNYWMKSETEGDTNILIAMESRLYLFDAFSIREIPGAEYHIYVDQEFVIDGHPCQAFTLEYDGWYVHSWIATDLNRVLASEFVNDDMLLFMYFYADTYTNRDDSFFETPENVDFPLVLGE